MSRDWGIVIGVVVGSAWALSVIAVVTLNRIAKALERMNERGG